MTTSTTKTLLALSTALLLLASEARLLNLRSASGRVASLNNGAQTQESNYNNLMEVISESEFFLSSASLEAHETASSPLSSDETTSSSSRASSEAANNGSHRIENDKEMNKMSAAIIISSSHNGNGEHGADLAFEIPVSEDKEGHDEIMSKRSLMTVPGLNQEDGQNGTSHRENGTATIVTTTTITTTTVTTTTTVAITPLAASSNNKNSTSNSSLVYPNQVDTSPTHIPTNTPSVQPSTRPSSHPSLRPSLRPTHGPSSIPSSYPSLAPSVHPSFVPTRSPSMIMSFQPATAPTPSPSNILVVTEPDFSSTNAPSIIMLNSLVVGSPTTNTNSPVTSPTNVQEEASCSAHPICAALGLDGACCPTTDSLFLQCCEQFWQTSAPLSAPSSSYPSLAPSVHPSFVPTRSPSMIMSFQPTTAPTPSPSNILVVTEPDFSSTNAPSIIMGNSLVVGSTTTRTNSPVTSPTNVQEAALCSANPICAALGLDGACCPTTDSLFLQCCEQFWQTLAPSPVPFPSTALVNSAKPTMVIVSNDVTTAPRPSSALQITDTTVPYEANAAVISGNFTMGTCTYTTAIYADVVDYGGTLNKDNRFYIIPDARNMSLQLTSGGSECSAEPHGDKESVTCTFSSDGIDVYPHSQVVGSGVSCVWECIGEPPHQFNMRLGVSDPGFLPVPGEEKFVVIRGDHDAQTDEFIYNNGEENLSCSLVLQIQGDSLKLVSSSGHVNQTVAIITEFSRTVYDANPTLMCQEQDESRNAFIFPGEFTFSCTFLDDLIQAAVSDRHVNTASPKGTAFGTCYIRLGAETFQPVVRL